MSKNISYGLKLVRDEICFRVGNKVLVKRTNTVAAPDVRVLIASGLVECDPTNGRVNITVDGLLRVNSQLAYRTRKKAEDFIRNHDSFYFLDGSLRATDGGYISRYVADFFIENGTLVLRPDGRYGKVTVKIEVSGDIYPAVKAFVEMLEHARS